MKDYIILKSTDAADLCARVIEKMKDGYKVAGGLSMITAKVPPGEIVATGHEAAGESFVIHAQAMYADYYDASSD